MKYYLIAGEASGDLHGSNLMNALKNADPQASFRFLGGDLMQSHGGELVKHYADMAFMGFVEVVANLSTVLKNLRSTKEDIARYQPDVLILIDFPGFNLKIAEYAKNKGIKVIYYISPKVWAWNQKRVLKIKKVVDKMLCILPFEVDFYKSWGMDVAYVGNPLLDAIAAHRPDNQFINRYGSAGKKIIALLPGSRKQEISKILPKMIAVADRFSDFQFIIAGAPSFDIKYYEEFIQDRNIPVVFNATYDLLNNSEAAIVTSGTATLETALLHVPEIVVYSGNPISISIARLVIKIRFISLVNLIMDKEVVKELIQQDCNPDRISEELNALIFDKHYRSMMLKNYEELSVRMGEAGASSRAATAIMEELTSF